MSEPQVGAHVEHGTSWRALLLAAGGLGVLGLVDAVLPAVGLPTVVWAVAVPGVLGLVAVGVLSVRRAWSVRVDGETLSVGRESVPLRDIDAGHLAGAHPGADAGAPVLGGAWSVPPGRSALPLRLAGGRTVLVPTRDPAALRAALLRSRGTLEP